MNWTRDDFTILGYPLQANVQVQILERNKLSDRERTRFLNMLCKMCSHQRSVPKSMRIPDCSYEQIVDECRGGYADIFRGEDRGRSVAIKVIRLYLSDDLEMRLSVRPFQSHWR